MIDTRPIAMIEADDRRRAQISYAGAAAGLHVEPYESVGELHALANTCAILVYDGGQDLAQALDHCDRLGHWLPIVAYSAEPTSTRVADAVFAGALDYLAWPFSAADLRDSLERVGRRGAEVGKRRINAATAVTKLRSLSGREREVVDGMAEGLSNKEIAKQLQISPRTVEIHRANAIGKLGVASSSAAIIMAATSAAGRV